MPCEKSREAITRIYNLVEVDHCISKFVKQQHKQDFKQEIFLRLLETPCLKIMELEESGKLRYYIVRIIINEIRNKYSLYNKRYVDPAVTYDTDKLNYESLPPSEFNSMVERQIREDKQDRQVEEIKNLDESMGTFYHRELLALIVKHGSMREVSRQLGIPKSSISDSVKRVREHLNSVI